MKTNLIKGAMTMLIACGIVLPTLAHGADKKAKAGAHTDVGSRFSSDKPTITYLFRHTHDQPYDIKRLSWYGGIMERIVVLNTSNEPIAINFEIRNLTNGVVASANGSRRVNRVCDPGKRVVLLDMLEKDGNSKLSYQFSHKWQSAGQALATQNFNRLSCLPESMPFRYTGSNLGSVF